MRQVFLILCIAGSFSAQEKQHRTIETYESSLVVLNGGAGLGFFSFYGFVGVMKPSNTLDVGLRYCFSRELVIEFAIAGNPGFDRPIQYISEFDLLVGKTIYSREYSLSFFTGLSAVGGVFRGKLLTSSHYGQSSNDEFERLDKLTVGIPMEARFAVRPSQYVDIGISKFVNFNSKKIYHSFTLSVQLAAPL